MAIDTALKRRAAAGTCGLPNAPGVTPDSDKGSAWRAQAGWSYMAAATPTANISGGSWSLRTDPGATWAPPSDRVPGRTWSVRSDPGRTWSENS